MLSLSLAATALSSLCLTGLSHDMNGPEIVAGIIIVLSFLYCYQCYLILLLLKL